MNELFRDSVNINCHVLSEVEQNESQRILDRRIYIAKTCDNLYWIISPLFIYAKSGSIILVEYPRIDGVGGNRNAELRLFDGGFCHFDSWCKGFVVFPVRVGVRAIKSNGRCQKRNYKGHPNDADLFPREFWVEIQSDR